MKEVEGGEVKRRKGKRGKLRIEKKEKKKHEEENIKETLRDILNIRIHISKHIFTSLCIHFSIITCDDSILNS